MSDYLLPFRLAFTPRSATPGIASLAAWWRPFITMAALTILVALLSHSMAVNLTLAHLPPTATPDDRAQVKEWLDAGLPARTLLLPLRFSMECALSGIMLLVLARAFIGRQTGSFRSFFILSSTTAVVPLMGRVAGFIISLGATPGSTRFLAMPFSAALLVPTEGDYRIQLLLTSLNLITLWYVGLVTVGVAVLCRCKAWKAILVAVAAWTVTTVVSITVLALLRNAFRFGL